MDRVLLIRPNSKPSHYRASQRQHRTHEHYPTEAEDETFVDGLLDCLARFVTRARWYFCRGQPDALSAQCLTYLNGN